MTHPNYIIINADDVGLHPDIDKGVDIGIQKGIINSISIIAISKECDWEKIRYFRDKKVFTGVHLTFVGLHWKTRNYYFPNWQHFMFKVFIRGKTFLHAILEESRWQIEKLVAEEIPLHHIDSEDHTHVLPGIWPLIQELSLEYSIPRIRLPVSPTIFSIRKNIGGLCLQFFSLLKKNQKKYLPCIGIKYSGQNTYEKIAKEIKLARGKNIELIVHPGINSQSLNSIKSFRGLNYNWYGELKLLLDKRFINLLEKTGYEIVKLE